MALALGSVGLGACATNQVVSGGETSRSAGAAPVRVASHKSHAQPPQAMLAPLPEPDCTFKDNTSGNGDAVRMKLDYERQCYRQSELIARQRLRELQDTVEQGKQR